MAVNIIIGADLVPTSRNYEFFKNGDLDKLIGKKLFNKLRTVDYTIFNLEVPLYDGNTPIEKYGPNLCAPEYTIKGIKKINPHFFTLANNHIFDHGEEGLISTVNILKKNKIEFSGVGSKISDASLPFIKEVDGIKVGIYCCTESEFSIALENAPGANVFDPLNSLDHIEKLSSKVDFIIVLYHGGKEHYRYPSPYLQKICRRMVDKGADLVVCQHSHCIGCKEDWNKGTIIYGQGNFLFDDNEDEFWNTSLLLHLKISKERYDIDYVPLIKYKEGVRLAKEKDKINILNDFNQRSEKIKIPTFVNEQYKEFAQEKIDGYLYGISGSGFLYRIINKLSGYKFNHFRMKYKYSRKKRIILTNYIECEAHRELLLQGLKFKK